MHVSGRECDQVKSSTATRHWGTPLPQSTPVSGFAFTTHPTKQDQRTAMGDFMSNLWTSVFTPGATPTLLVATNVTFAALQLLLVALLVATHSVHFLILSTLCGGLWYSINWFAAELRVVQAKEQEAEKLRQRKHAGWRSRGEVEDSAADDEGEETEVDERGLAGSMDEAGLASISRGATTGNRTTAGGIARGATQASGVDPAVGAAETRRRGLEDSDRSGEVSTDSEWEKVEQ